MDVRRRGVEDEGWVLEDGGLEVMEGGGWCGG
jgi:hypothetical protein